MQTGTNNPDSGTKDAILKGTNNGLTRGQRQSSGYFERFAFVLYEVHRQSAQVEFVSRLLPDKPELYCSSALRRQAPQQVFYPPGCQPQWVRLYARYMFT